ncbi:MAG: HAMP domain-containing sensor histidine kinase [Vicinamibacterales bacterium]
MQVGARRFSAVTVLVGIVMLLVPALAWMQYQWLGQLSQSESERMHRTLRTAASQFAVDFDSELSKAMVGLQVEGSVLRDRNWTSYAQRYTGWVDGASTPKMLREVLLVESGKGVEVRLPGFGDESAPHRAAATDVTVDDLRLMRWNVSTLTFDAIDWPPDLTTLRASLVEHLDDFHAERTRGNGGPDRFRRDGNLASVLSDDETLVNPITVFEPPTDRVGPPKITILGFTIVRLDPAVIRDALLPALAARHLHGDDGTPEYRLAVVNRADPSKVVWESEPGAAGAIVAAPDVSQDFMAPRPDRMFVLKGRDQGSGTRDQTEASPVPAESIMVSVLERRGPGGGSSRVVTGGRPFGAVEGRWTLVAKHRAGSLEAAVAAVRMRNLLLSSGILLLLTMSVGFIVVSSRRAQELARQQMEFVAAVSHELRTPVSVIGTAASNLADGVVSDPQRVRKYGETIQTEARRLAETVERVLQLAGIAAGRAAAAQSLVCPADLISDSIHACKTEIEAAGVTVETDVPMDIPMVSGDVAALRSALQNLISNAVKYGGEARWIRVSASAGAGNPKGLPPRSAGGGGKPSAGGGGKPSGLPGQVVFTVEDRGLGIDAEDRKHIFEPFYRGRDAVSKQIHGSGLGLNLVHRIAEAHGGRVSVASDPGKGSVFSLALPAVNEAAQVTPVAVRDLSADSSTEAPGLFRRAKVEASGAKAEAVARS